MAKPELSACNTCCATNNTSLENTTEINSSELCFHCGTPVGADNHRSVAFEGKQNKLCSAECETAAHSILDSGFNQYYTHRTKLADSDVLHTSQYMSDIYDAPEIQAQYTVPEKTGARVSLAIDGMHCGACVGLIEHALDQLPGVSRASVNLTSARAEVHFDPQHSSLAQIIDALSSIGYKAYPYQPNQRADARKQLHNKTLKRLSLAGLAAMQTMMFALPGYLTGDDGIETQHALLFQWASFALTIPVLLYSAVPFWTGAWRSIVNRRPGMDVPVALAIGMATIASVYALLRGQGEVYFDSVAMFVFLLLGARYLEWSVRCRSADTLDAMDAQLPQTAHLLYSGGQAPLTATKELTSKATTTIPAVRLRTNDVITVFSGERVPADGVVLQGLSTVDRSLLTGESIPVAVTVDDEVPGGAVVAESPLVLRVTNVQADSAMSMISRLVTRGGHEKPPLIRLTDRIATVFVSLLLALAALTFTVWWQIDSQRALTIAISVLIVSCPCALSLATPATLAAATAGLLRRHLLITRAHTLETLSKVSDVVFDKTGTLTQGKPELKDIQCADQISTQQALNLAAFMENGSDHPFAKAIIQAQLKQTTDKPVELTSTNSTDIWHTDNLAYCEHVTGAGVSTTLKSDPNLRLKLGTALWCGVTDPDKYRGGNADDLSEVFLIATRKGDDTNQSPQVLARFSFDDPIRPEAFALLRYFQLQNVQVHLLSGDRDPVVTRVANTLGFQASNVTAAASPQHKQAYATQLQRNGKTVLMLGDGINDAPVLASADVSVAIGKASALACTAADAVLLSEQIEDIGTLHHSAQRATRIIRQNLCWAATYNLLAIPLAATGMVPPWMAAVGMSASSLLVAGNALRASHINNWKISTHTVLQTDAINAHNQHLVATTKLQGEHGGHI